MGAICWGLRKARSSEAFRRPGLADPDAAIGCSEVTTGAQTHPPAATVLYKPDADLLEALLAPLKQGGRRLFLFVNGPVEPGIDALLAALPNAKIVRSPDNVGLGAGLNAVMGAASGEGFGHILLFDQDSTPDEALAGKLMARFHALDRAPHPLAAPTREIEKRNP